MSSLNLNQFVHEAATDRAGETTIPAFAALIGLIDEAHKWTILDIAPPSAANIGFFTQFRCKLYIEDIQKLLGTFGANPDEDLAVIKNWYAQLLPRMEQDKFDMVNCWDILNYLNPPLLTAFITQLSEIMQPGAHLHALIYSQKTMPKQPMRFRVMGLDKLAYELTSTTQIPCPRYHQLDLKNLMREFTVMKSVFLRNGMQEYLFRKMT